MHISKYFVGVQFDRFANCKSSLITNLVSRMEKRKKLFFQQMQTINTDLHPYATHLFPMTTQNTLKIFCYQVYSSLV